MKCPICSYVDGGMWQSKKDNPIETEWVVIEGNKGDFYIHPVKVERREIGSPDTQRKDVYGCPSCGVMFIDL